MSLKFYRGLLCMESVNSALSRSQATGFQEFINEVRSSDPCFLRSLKWEAGKHEEVVGVVLTIVYSWSSSE